MTREHDILDELIERGAQLRERVRRIHDRLGQGRRLPARDLVDAAVLDENDSILQRLEDTARRELAQIEHALRRAERDGCLRCERCGDSIDDGRLRIVPATTFCGCCSVTL